MKLAFSIGVYKDQTSAQQRIQCLQKFYPDCDIVSIADGHDDPDYAAFCASREVRYTLGSRLKLMEFGGLWIERFLKALLDTDADFLIKIDPDTGIHASLDLTRLPPGDVLGNVRENYGKRHIQGGFIGFWRHAAQTIVDSGLLLDPLYCTHRYAYPRYQPPYLKAQEKPSREWQACEDLVLWEIVGRLGLRVGELDQVYCDYRECPVEAISMYAMTHPCVD